MNKLCRIMWASSENCWFGWGHVGMFYAYGATPREVYTSLLKQYNKWRTSLGYDPVTEAESMTRAPSDEIFHDATVGDVLSCWRKG